MELYHYSWLILFAPLLSFVVIIFGTRMWDLASRPRSAAAPPAYEHGYGSHDAHDDHNASDGHGEHDDDHEPYDDNPTVPRLTTGARASSLVGLLIMAGA